MISLILFLSLAAAATVDAKPLIVIDPGHGGWQQGAVGACDLTEKDLTLGIARELGALLEASEHVRVAFTRSGDYSVTLKRRAAIANRDGARLLVSLHANASQNPRAHGAETFFLSNHASSLRVNRLARRENEDAHDYHDATPDDLLSGIVDSMELTEVHHESQRLAQRLQTALEGKLSGRGRGVLQAPFRVLREADMPAALIEVGFLSHPDECTLLATSARQHMIARSIATAILVHIEVESPAVAQR